VSLMSSSDFLPKQLEAILGEGRPTGTGEINFCCPLCKDRRGSSDTKFHLYVNPTRFLHGIKGWFYCHRCHATGPISRLVSGESVGQTVQRWNDFVQELSGVKPKEKKQQQEVVLPRDYRPVVKCTEAYRYLRDRGLSDDTIRQYRLGFGTQNLRDVSASERRLYAGSGRIIFPDYSPDGEIVYWVARTYKGHAIKYKNPPNSNARDKLYNLVRASRCSAVVITEGVMSAIAAGDNAVATYGKDVTRTQVAMLVAAGFRRYYVALDGDAFKSKPGGRRHRTKRPPAVKLADALFRRGCETYIVQLPYWEDPDSVEDFRLFLTRARRYDVGLQAELLSELFS